MIPPTGLKNRLSEPEGYLHVQALNQMIFSVGSVDHKTGRGS